MNKPLAIQRWKRMLVCTAALAILFPLSGKADSLIDDSCVNVTKRPLSDFLSAQGILNDPPQFFPPVKDYSGWAGGDGINFALVDYAGIADKHIQAQTGQSIGTKVHGVVLECALPNGKAQVSVTLIATKALGFAQSIQDLINNNFDFLNTPTIFGAKTQDVISGAKPATGSVNLATTFSIPAPGASLPDLIDVVFNPASYAPVKISFKSTTRGKCTNGKANALLEVHQVGATNESNALVFQKENVAINGKKGGDCSS
ncbi:hypothetical protein C8R34_12532 [Nitrosomonas sp. Nm84]|uniref:hypothetical protein n=1 Tax=Nitrosomonas sp. Nm84 TaxID=200124 RepID=UPI000D7732FA|nr:hypothetical protein [Nitrosomonas sp. Nm84]PXW83894.1 hypothetical protein C8R34_12532 [Nitrosomonas sp. Nm84]